MDFLTQLVPSWVSLLFLAVILIPTFLIAGLARKGSKDGAQGAAVFGAVVTFYLVYLGYVAYTCLDGWFDAQTLPPMILRYTMIPLLLFLLVIVFNLPIYKSILHRTKLSDLVRIHIFRLIGSFFLILGFFKALPPSIAIIAGCGDLITAISSIFVARAIDSGKSYARPLTWAWNTFGFLDILATSASALILTKLAIDTGSQGVEALGQFPFCFIPAFAPATIIFLHFSVYRKLQSTRKGDS